MQKHILGSWKRDFDKILFTYSKSKSLHWIYRWTRWATQWQPAQFKCVGSLPLNCTRVDSSGIWTTRTRTWSDSLEPLLTLNAYTVYCIISRSTVSRTQPVFHLSADHVVLNSLDSHNYKLTSEYSVSSHCASLPNHRLQIDLLQVLLQSRSITASKCISKLAQSEPPSGISKHARLRPPTASPNSHNYGLQVPMFTASKCISHRAQSQPPSTSLRSDSGCMKIQG